jgi:hypothetical protein
MIGTEEELEPHILAQDMDDVASIKCWGMMEVGNVAWEAYHSSGVHPMSLVFGVVKDAYERTFGTDG